ncbi:hypothetical protein [Dyadobacter sp. CY323]|uniref:hypothetical protein n=1 Tax=Dyadobacter sp. CY323 TaxID=2907302 RepID=UPI001F182306|nr:hypothetical protein [Dyadobacter sp. CY323]MCE6992334.1 hypothetical protein [Dyadobacter sp. CY323]
MKRSTRILLGVSIALITAASLHVTVGERFHRRMPGKYGAFGCRYDWKDPTHNSKRSPTEPLKSPTQNFNDNQ